MFERICSCHILALRRRSLELAEQAYQQEEVQPRETYSSTRQPSERERRLHEITHLPFRQWCPFCVAGKSRADYKHPVEAEDVQQREFPVIQLDTMLSPGGNSVLLLIDTWTRFIFTAAMKTKSAKVISTSISEFLGILGYFRKIEIVSDNEPVIVSGIKHLETIVQLSKAFDKGRTAVAERAIQTVRSQARTLVNYVEHQIEAKFPDGHPIHMWALLHSAWLLNRFHRHSALGCTPYQSLFGRPYKGQVANFGQDMYGISQKKTKYKAQWTRGVWVGKDHADQDMLIFENDKILKSKAVRATGLFWNKNDLVNMEVTPDHLLKKATQRKGVYPVIPPLQCLPPRSDDEAAPDPPDDQGGEDSQVPPLIPIPMSAKVRDNIGPMLPIQQRSPLNLQELSQLPFSADCLKVVMVLQNEFWNRMWWVTQGIEAVKGTKLFWETSGHRSLGRAWTETNQNRSSVKPNICRQYSICDWLWWSWCICGAWWRQFWISTWRVFLASGRWTWCRIQWWLCWVFFFKTTREGWSAETNRWSACSVGSWCLTGGVGSTNQHGRHKWVWKQNWRRNGSWYETSFRLAFQRWTVETKGTFGCSWISKWWCFERRDILTHVQKVGHSHVSCACIGAAVKCAANGCQGRIPYSTTARSCHHWDTHLGEVKWHGSKWSWFLEAGEMLAWPEKGSIALAAWTLRIHSQQVWLHSFWGHGDSVQTQGQMYVHHNTCWRPAHYRSSGRVRMVQSWNFPMLSC